jgi:acyl-CoA synthetase (NDP forming)
MAPLPERAISFLEGILPGYWSRKNPIDMVAASEAKSYFLTLEKLLGLSEYNMAFLIGYGVLGSIALPSLNAKDAEFAMKICSLVKRFEKPLYVVDVLGKDQSESARIFERAGIPVFSTVRAAVESAEKMVKYSEYLCSARKRSEV